ncbi:MAG: nucleoid-associated protein, YbaB/EbfC family [Gammaproteobacteria bacterium]|nr:nucleoid-associated protein, YbaB/EbfC family [Gammaproteobacteria bacterium]|tara:strand:+ start:8408 stop:8740 length:333 start_codon:yes stop_codon:yes gene_type:complete
MLKGLGGMGDMMGLMKQAQKMKKDMKKLKKEISKTNITVSDSNNILTVVMNGDHILQKINFTDDFDFSDSKKVELIVKDVINQASKEVDKMSSDKMSVLSKQGLPTDLPF